jgi:hypothetical protein
MAGPYGCTRPGATTPANLTGVWQVRQRDDTDANDVYSAWTDIIPHVFAADGSFSENTNPSTAVGRWCVRGDVLLWGYDDSPMTTYRVVIGSEPMHGFMSFNNGGTGEMEVRRLAQNAQPPK